MRFDAFNPLATFFVDIFSNFRTSLNGELLAGLTKIPPLTVEDKNDYETNTTTIGCNKTNPYLPYNMLSDSVDTIVRGLMPFGLNYNIDVLIGQYQSNTEINYGIRSTSEYFTDASVTLRQH